MMNKKITFCEYCRKDVLYSEKKESISGELKGEIYKYSGKTANCDECSNEIFVNEINDYNLKQLYNEFRKQNNIIVLEKILEINYYQIRCLWNDGFERITDLKQFIAEKSMNKNNSYSILQDKNIFRTAKCDGNSIFWENCIEYIDLDGSSKLGPLDISPEFLFELSVHVMKLAV